MAVRPETVIINPVSTREQLAVVGETPIRTRKCPVAVLQCANAVLCIAPTLPLIGKTDWCIWLLITVDRVNKYTGRPHAVEYTDL